MLFLRTYIVLFTYTSLFGVAGLLAKSSGACHFFLPGSSLRLALSDVLTYKSPKPQSFAVHILLTNTLRALMLQWRRSLLWRKSYREKKKERFFICWLICAYMFGSVPEIVVTTTLYSPVQRTHVRPW